MPVYTEPVSDINVVNKPINNFAGTNDIQTELEEAMPVYTEPVSDINVVNEPINNFAGTNDTQTELEEDMPVYDDNSLDEYVVDTDSIDDLVTSAIANVEDDTKEDKNESVESPQFGEVDITDLNDVFSKFTVPSSPARDVPVVADDRTYSEDNMIQDSQSLNDTVVVESPTSANISGSDGQSSSKIEEFKRLKERVQALKDRAHDTERKAEERAALVERKLSEQMAELERQREEAESAIAENERSIAEQDDLLRMLSDDENNNYDVNHKVMM